MTEGQYTEKYSRLGQIYSIKAFRQFVSQGTFIDYDGYGNPMKDKMINPSIKIYPSSINEIPSDATHICWYNR